MKWLLGTLAAVVLACIIWGTWFVMDFKENRLAVSSAEAAIPEQPLTAEQKDRLEERFIGDVNAPVALYVFSSFTCYHCAVFAKEVIPVLTEKYVKDGKLVIYFKDVMMDKRAAAASMLSRCVPKDKYLQFTDVLFNTQSKWGMSTEYKDILAGYAVMEGMSDADAKSCMEDKALLKGLVNKRDRYVNKYSIMGTPTVLVVADGKTEQVNHSGKGRFIAAKIDSILAQKEQKDKPAAATEPSADTKTAN